MILLILIQGEGFIESQSQTKHHQGGHEADTKDTSPYWVPSATSSTYKRCDNTPILATSKVASRAIQIF